MVDQAAVVRRKVLSNLEIGLCVKKHVLVSPTVIDRSNGNHFYNLSQL